MTDGPTHAPKDHTTQSRVCLASSPPSVLPAL